MIASIARLDRSDSIGTIAIARIVCDRPSSKPGRVRVSMTVG